MWRRYRRAPLANPYFPKRTRTRSWKKIFITGAIFVIILTGGILYSPLLRVETMDVRGLTLTPVKVVEEHLRERIPVWMRMPFVRLEPLETSLKEAFLFHTVSIRKKFPHTLIVTVEERLPYAIWQTGERAYILDQTGSIMRQVGTDEPRPDSLISYFDESQEFVEEGTVIAASTLATIDHVRETVRARHGRTIAGVKFPSRGSLWVKFVVDEGWEVYLDLTGDVDHQLTKLGAVLEELGDRRTTIHYIDVRFADRAYYQ